MIRKDTEKLSLPEGRRVGQPGHAIALQYLESRMREIGLIPFKNNDFSLPYESFTNLAGVLEGTDETALPVLIGAHYDSAIDAPCSDDNAVSVALILSIAETLSKRTLERSVIVAFFDAEENPYFLKESMGSIRFYNDHCADIDFACVIILDMVGHDFQSGLPIADTLIPGIKELLFVLGSESHEQLPDIVERAFSGTGKLRVIPTLNRYIGDRSDYHVFRKAGEPYLFISRGWGKYSHTSKDDINWINFEAVKGMKDFLIRILMLLDKAQMDSGRVIIDPFEYEIRMMKKAAGWFLPLFLLFMGFYRMSLHSREDLDTLAEKLSTQIDLEK